MPDIDLVREADMDSPEDTLVCCKKLLRYLIKEINKYVDARFEDLYRKRSGAVRKGEPRIIWVKMIRRTTTADEVSDNFRIEYNNYLDDQLLAEGHTYMLELKTMDDERFYDRTGCLLSAGRIQLWKELDQQLKEFDRKKNNLLPQLPKNLLLKSKPSQQQGRSDQPKVITPKRVQDRYHVDNRPWQSQNVAQGRKSHMGDRFDANYQAGDYNYPYGENLQQRY